MKHTVILVEHGVVADTTENILGYSAWPSVERAADGALLAVYSGNRLGHICPFGKVLLRRSLDEGRTWSAPTVVFDTPLDDRDAGCLHLGDGRLLATTFNNTRQMQRDWAKAPWNQTGGAVQRMIEAYCDLVTDEQERAYFGSLAALSEDNGQSWSAPFHVPVSAPHGAALGPDGAVLYAGTMAPDQPAAPGFPIQIYKSTDGGQSFFHLSGVPVCPDFPDAGHYEPHLLALPDGRLVLTIRHDGEGLFTVSACVSDDGGRTWTTPRATGAQGAPPHLLLHSSGTLLCTYGRRTEPFGVEVMFSDDRGESWGDIGTLWDGGVDGDLGYPCSVELPGGDIFTLYYAKPAPASRCAILYTRWRLG